MKKKDITVYFYIMLTISIRCVGKRALHGKMKDLDEILSSSVITNKITNKNLRMAAVLGIAKMFYKDKN